MDANDTRTLHQDLFGAIESGNTEKSLFIIHHITSCQDIHCNNALNLLDRYTHKTQWPFSPLIHCILKENAQVAQSLLENGCDPGNFFSKEFYFSHKTATRLNFDFFFRIIGKPHFRVIVMRILESTNKVIKDKDGNTVLHLICQNKLISWLKMILLSPSQRDLIRYTNKHGYLPMHVSAESNFFEFFHFIFKESFERESICDDGDAYDINKTFGDCSIKSCEFSSVGQKVSVSSKTIDSLRLIKGEGKDVDGDNDGSKTCLTKGIDKSAFKCKSENVIKSGEDCIDKYYMDINSPILGKGTTVLHIAAEQKNYKLVRFLLENGGNVLALNFRHHSPLYSCLYSTKSEDVTSNFMQVCRELILAGSQVNGFFSNKNYFLRKRMGIVKRFDHIFTLLHMAADIGCEPVVELLLSKGADPTILSRDLGRLPLQIALEKCHTGCARILMNQSLYPEKFLVSFIDSQSNSLLHSACKCNDEIIVNELVINCKSYLDQANQFDVYPLDKAIFHGNISFIHAILTSRPEIVNICQWQQFKTRPPLHLAASSPLSHLPLPQVLLSYGADIYAKAYNKKNMAYRTALRSDCYENAVYLVEQMSRPFTVADRKELLEYAENRMGNELVLRLKHRLENVPSLLFHCLDTVRQALIENCHSFKFASSLPIPNKMIWALKYREANQC